MNCVTKFLMRFAKPYRKGHLIHADGSLYMGRWSLFETHWLSARIHHIATPDNDRHLHDHPFHFLSVILSGGYVEQRPRSIDPCFVGNGRDWEACTRTTRRSWSVAFRKATDRHLISQVEAGTYTLVIYSGKVQWWGFYTPKGKIYWEDYATCHVNAIGANAESER